MRTSNPEQPEASGGVNPTRLVAAIVGSDAIILRGFGVPAMPPSLLRPGMLFVGVEESAAAAAELPIRARRITRILHILTGAALSLTLVGGGYIASLVLSPPKAVVQEARLLNWHVASVEQAQVIVETQGQRLRTRIGAKLPNGETLVATHPERMAYSTNRGTTSLASRSAATAMDQSITNSAKPNK